MGTLTLWRREDLLSFVSNASVDAMVIGSRLQIDWGNDESIAKVGVMLCMLSM